MSRPTTPNAVQLDHLVDTAGRRRLTPDENAALRTGVRQLRASLAGAGAAIRRAPSGAYHQQVVQQLADERADRETAKARITAARALHRPVEFVESWTCAECSRTGQVAPSWPCPTIVALDGATSTAWAQFSVEVDGRWQVVPGVQSVEVTTCLVAEPADDPGAETRSLRVTMHPGWTPPPSEAEVREQVTAILAAAPTAIPGQAAVCAGCGSAQVVYRNHADVPLCCPCAHCCSADEARR